MNSNEHCIINKHHVIALFERTIEVLKIPFDLIKQTMKNNTIIKVKNSNLKRNNQIRTFWSMNSLGP